MSEQSPLSERAPIVVMKFGGTSVGTLSRIKQVADIIAAHRRAHPDLGVVVVVSAMAGETDRLVGLARGVVEHLPDPRELDVLLASGEQVAVALVAMRLHSIGVPAKSMLAAQARIETDARHTDAQIEAIEGSSLQRTIAAGTVPVVAGFQGVDAQGDLTTLGRGGSDITAVAIAAALRAQVCYIYTDVRGVFSADPRICPAARLLDRVSHEEMLELASLGAKVLHTRSVYFAHRYRVPLVVLSTFAGACRVGENGTWIVSEEECMEQAVITGVTSRLDEARLTIEGVPRGIEVLARLFQELGEHGVLVDMISQEATAADAVNVSISIADERSTQAFELIRDLVPRIAAAGVKLERNSAKISVVGIGMRYHTDVAARLFRALARAQIEVSMVTTSEIKISVLVQRKYAEAAVRCLHEEFLG